MQKVKVGSTIPEFTLPDQNGNPFDIKSIMGKKNLVIYFYPKNDTAGCTKEACSFRDQYEDFKDAGAEVIGISSDNTNSHKNFSGRYNLNFILLSDHKGIVRKKFGVSSKLFGLIQGRVTYVANKEGRVIHMFDSQLQASRHISEALEALRNIRD